MADKKQIMIEVPAEVVEWLSREATNNFRSIRSEASYRLTEEYKLATGKTVETPTSVQDDLEDAAAEVPADTPAESSGKE